MLPETLQENLDNNNNRNATGSHYLKWRMPNKDEIKLLEGNQQDAIPPIQRTMWPLFSHVQNTLGSIDQF
jgi:hypothetical protein